MKGNDRPAESERAIKALLRAFSALHGLLALLFAAAALMLVIIAAKIGWAAFVEGLTQAPAQRIIEAVGLLAAAVVALQIAQTIAEEEVVRTALVSGPTRVRRFLSRFLASSSWHWPSKPSSPLSGQRTKLPSDLLMQPPWCSQWESCSRVGASSSG